ncbi:hypothetical protein [Alkalibaculum bacchi]|uniref:hypothetical protein n=1 Tax=Alkalibaculum bacchi TaxID=645887 RepID=UPI00350E49DD
MSNKIQKAIEFLPHVVIDDELLETAAKISTFLGVDGHRADMVMIKTAMTIAALKEREKVEKRDLVESAAFVLPHRMRRRPFEESLINMDIIEEKINEFI